jgi:hypothetical protein
MATSLAQAESQAIVHARETSFALPFDGAVTAWFPIPLTCLRAAPDGSLWAGADGNHLCVLLLEGGVGAVENDTALAIGKTILYKK